MNIENLTPEERKAMLVKLQAEDRAEKAAKEAEIKTYKELVSQTVMENFPRLEEVSKDLAKHKQMTRSSFAAIMEMKAQLFGVKETQKSHQFMNTEGTHRMTIGFNMNDNYDDTVDVGIEMVRECISSLAHDEKSKILVETVLKLLSKDSKGTLKASRVLQLQQIAERLGDEKFIEGVKIIRDAYRPIESKSYVKAEYKNENGAWISIPLGMTEAE